jgi:hypothetical protein
VGFPEERPETSKKLTDLQKKPSKKRPTEYNPPALPRPPVFKLIFGAWASQQGEFQKKITNKSRNV